MRLIALCAAALAGLVLGELHPSNPGPQALAALGAAAAAALSWQHQAPWRSVALLTCAFALGAMRAALPAVPGPAPPAPLVQVRSVISARLSAELPEPQASLATGVVLGGPGRLGAPFKAQLQRAGLTHVLAIDGYKQVIIGAVISALAVKTLGARLAVLPSVGAIAGYTLLTGAHPSAVRAGLMVALAQLAALSGRVADPLTSLLLAITLMALLDPRVLLELGLQLSAGAVLGIVLLWPRLRRSLRRLPRGVAEPVGLTLAVTLGTLPVTLAVFQVVSLVSPLAHVVALPLLPLVLAGSAVLATLAPLPVLGPAAAWLAWLPTTLLVRCIELFGSLPGAAISTGRLSSSAALWLAAALLIWGLWLQPELVRVRRRVARGVEAHRSLVVPVGLAAASLSAVAAFALARPDGRLHVEALDVQRGQAVFVRGPTGRSVLVVLGRADAIQLVDGVADHLAVWEHKLGTVVVLDAGAERALGLTLARYPADDVVRGAATVYVAPDERVSVGAAADGRILVQAVR